MVFYLLFIPKINSFFSTFLCICVVAPQIGVFTFGDEPLNAGDTAAVTCSVTKGDLPMEIQWMFQSELVDEKREDIIISNFGKRGKQLSIEAVGARHAGEYTCVASNLAGSTSRSAILAVNGILLKTLACDCVYISSVKVDILASGSTHLSDLSTVVFAKLIRKSKHCILGIYSFIKEFTH